VGAEGSVVLADLNIDMITEGRRRLDDRGLTGVRYVQVNAEALPFPDHHFDVASIAFGLRNVARKDVALREMRRVLKPGGRVLVLEFSQPRSRLVRSGYRVWQSLWPGIGKAITGDAGPYRYLVDSIATHPDQETLATMLRDAGFTGVRCHDLMDGIVALHLGTAPVTDAVPAP
jgi:demethylmenaquinone methyltransferase/2-methoxy-6-polyprenyl-1,4-benzoquinol methylase